MTPQEIIDLLPETESGILVDLLNGGMTVDDVLNALIRMACTLAIAADVAPEIFAAGIKTTWREYADQINLDATLKAMPAKGQA